MRSKLNVVLQITTIISIIIISFPSLVGATAFPSAVINQTEILPLLNDMMDESQAKPTGLAIGQAQTIQNEDVILVATDGVAGDKFGRVVSIDGDTMVVGAMNVDGDIGAAYVFELVNGSWVETVKLRPDQLTGRVYFGASVVVKNDTIVVGAQFEDTSNGSETGAVYIFEQDQAGSWNQTQKLFPAGSNSFGSSVDMTNDMLVVGDVSEATVYVFEPNQAGSWVETAQLTTTDDLGFGFFADNIAIQNTTVVVNNWGDSTNGPLSGAVYIFDQAGNGSWSQTQKLIPNDNASNDAFGYDIAFQGNRIVVGAVNDDDYGNNSGAAYVFENINGSWTETAKLTDSNSATQNTASFGRSVAVDNDFIVIGNGQTTGPAYLFEYVPSSGWLKTTSLTASNNGSNSHDPNGIAIQNDLVVAGSDDAEAVYLYQVSTQVNTQNLLANGGFEGGDLSGWSEVVSGITVDSGNTAYSGQHGITLSGHGRIDQVIDTVTGQQYQVSAYIRLDQEVIAPTWGGIRIQVADFPSWTQLGRTSYINAGSHPYGQTVALGDWVYVSFSFTAMSDQAIIGFTNFSNGEFVASADDFRVEQLPTSPPLVPRPSTQQNAYQTYLPFIIGSSNNWASLADQELTWLLACAEDACPTLPSALAEAYQVYEVQSQ